MRNEYCDYNNEERPYIPARDPRGINIVENIQRSKEIKSQIPQIVDDHVCIDILHKYVLEMESEIYDLKNYKVVNELMAMFAEGGNITIEDDADFKTALVLEKDTTLNLNGKTLTVKEDTVGDGVFHVTGGTLTIEGEGVINGIGNNDYNMAIWADGGNVIINGGTFTNEGASAISDPAHMDLIYTKNGSTVEINGGFFRCETPKWTLNKHDGTESEIIVKGGTFVDYDPSNSETENPVANFVADGYKVIAEPQENGEIWYTVVVE